MIRRRKPLARSPITRSSKPIPRRRERPRRGPGDVPAEEWRNEAYRAWLREEGKCVACVRLIRRPDLIPGVHLEQLHPGVHAGYCDPAHTENNGMSSKGPDSSCAPLCRGFGLLNHHEEYDAGRERFERKYGLDMQREAAAHWYLWRLVAPST